MPDFRRGLEFLGFVSVLFLLFYLGFWQGVQVHSFTVDIFILFVEVVFLEAIFSSLFFGIFFLLTGASFFLRRNGVDGDPDSGKEFTCVIPTYRDAEVLTEPIKSLEESGYESYSVLLVGEPDDEAGLEEIRRLSESFSKVDFAVNDLNPGSKAGALNYALEEVETDYVFLLDADQRFEGNLLGKASVLLDENDFVQFMKLPRGDGLVERISFYSEFLLTLPREVTRLLTGFRLVSTSGVAARTESLREHTPLDEEVLTEDLDLAFRLYLDRCSFTDSRSVKVYNEAPHSLSDLWNQRKRWMVGYFQVFYKLLRRGFRRDLRSFTSPLICAASIFGSFLLLTLVSKFILILLAGAELWYMFPIVVIVSLSMLGTHFYSESDSLNWSWLLSPLVFPLLGLITVRSFFEFLIGRKHNWYRVEKSGD